MRKIILLLLTIPLLSFSIHKYYISLTQIEFNEKEKSVQLIMNVFMDDIEKAINTEYNTNLQLTTKNEHKKADVFFEKYLTENFHIKINNLDKKFNFIGKEYDGDIVYFYFEVDNVNTVNSIEIINTMLVKYFEDQQNLIKSKIYKKHKSLRLTKANDKGLLNF